MNSTVSTSTPPLGTSMRRVAQQLSPTLVGLAATFLAVGLSYGGLVYLSRSPVRAEHHPGTAAWWPHIGIFVLSAALFAGARLRRRRTRPTCDGRLLLLAPLGRPAARRIRRTVLAARHRPVLLVRLAAATMPAALLLYVCWRVGAQVLGGLDPNFTVNAWGGPTYLGAMACHYIDAVPTAVPSVWLLDRLLLPDRTER
jgi:hypothetical protein